MSECPKKKQLPIRAATSQLNLSEIEDGVAPDMDTVLAQYEDNEEEAIVSAGAITTRPTCLTIKLNNTSNLFLNVKINGYSCEAMVDNGATHKFITPACAKRWGLELQPLTNLSINFVQGFTNACALVVDVLIEVEEWMGRTSFLVVDMDGFEVILGLEWIDKFVINQFGKKVDKLLLDNEDGKGGVIVSMHRKHKGDTNHNTKANATSIVAILCTTKVASRALRKGGQLFLCTALITKPKSTTSKIQLGATTKSDRP